MDEPIYDRPRIIAEIETRFHRKQNEVGAGARPSDIVRAYFTNTLGAEPIRRLLKPEDPNSVAMDLNSALTKIPDHDKPLFVIALGYGISGVLYPDLMASVIEPWSTKEFANNVYDLFLAKAHLEKPDLARILRTPNQDTETFLKTTDALVPRAVRERIMPVSGKPAKVGYFFESEKNMSELPVVSRFLRNWVHPVVVTAILNGGQDFQAALDAITPTARPVAKRFPGVD